MHRSAAVTDESNKGDPPPLLRIMEIGDIVIYRGRQHVLLGLDPMSVDRRRAELEDLVTGERIWVPVSEVYESPLPAA